MTLRHLEIFIAVCESDSMTEAARRLHLAQSAVSLAVGELERRYGVRLFDRIGRRLYRTGAGERLLGHARHILESFAEMEREVQDRDSWGDLRIGASITIGSQLLPGLLSGFSARWPHIGIRVGIDQSAVIERRILRNELDLALIEGLVHEERIVGKTLCADELALVCGAGSRWRTAGPATLQALRGETFILRERGSGTRELFDSVMLTQGLLITPAWESVSTEAIVSAVAANLGLSVLPLRLVAADLAAGRLHRVAVADVDFRRQFRLIHHADKYLSRSMAAFIDHCVAELADRPAGAGVEPGPGGGHEATRH